jgi:hypothetical protein
MEERAKSWNFLYNIFTKKQYKLIFGIWNKLTIKVYTRQWVRAKIFCCDRNRALLKSSIVIEKNKYIVKI